MAEVLYLSAPQTRELVTGEEALGVMEQVLRWQAAGQVTWPEPNVFNLPMKQFNSGFRIKACSLDAVPVAGVRVTGFVEGASGDTDSTRYVILSDPRSGRPLAIVDEHYTYNLRTCAAAALALRRLARSESAIAGLVGAGAIAETSLELLGKLFPLAEVRVTSRRPESRAAFASRMSERLGLPVVARDTPREVVEGADLVVTCTSARRTLIYDGWLREGATLCALGWYEIDATVYRSVDKVVVSDWEVVVETPDVRDLVKAGRFSVEEVWADMASIVAGLKPGRESPRERILVRAVGLASQDVAICHHVYHRAVRQGVGTWLSQ